MLSPARLAAFHALSRIELGGAFSDQVLNSNLLAGLCERDRHLATELCYGTLRWQLFLDDALAEYSRRAWDEVEPRIRILLRMSLYQFWRTERIPDHALVNDAVEMAKKELNRGKAAFVNGLLRSLARTRPWEAKEFEQKRPPWIRASLPRWIWDRWSARYGSDLAFKFAVSLNQPPQRAVWAGDCRVRQECEATGAVRSDLVPGAMLADKAPPDGGHWIQDEASQLIPHLLDTAGGGKIWDACASPGGKAAILNSRSGRDGIVIASDLRPKRVLQMRKAFDKLQSKRPAVLVADASLTPPFRQGAFDAVLADVPCSGLGTMRRNPEIKWRFAPSKLPELHRRQRAILEAVSGSVRLGGSLLYSTCSTEPEENEEVVRSFLAAHPGFVLVRPHSPPGVEEWLDEQGVVRTFPSTRGWDGFFAAIMHRFS